MNWVLLTLPLSCSASKLEAVVAALSILSPNSLWTTLLPTFTGSVVSRTTGYGVLTESIRHIGSPESELLTALHSKDSQLSRSD
ncbi:hypothetical protein Tco_0361053 [Tanacetum coccineum]